MAKWVQCGVRTFANGEKTITYKAQGIDAWIESRKEAIPHANRGGVWMHTTYCACWPGGDVLEYSTLRDAKEAVERSARREE